MPIIIPAWDIGILSIKRSSQNQFNECRCPPLMMKSRASDYAGEMGDTHRPRVGGCLLLDS